MTTPELKPCPFCGGSAEHEQDRESHPHKPEPKYRVRCSNGDCVYPTPFDYEFTTPKLAARAWNTRAAQPQPPVIEGLDEALGRWKVWEPSPSAKMAFNDYNLYVKAAKLYAQGQTAQPVDLDTLKREAISQIMKEFVEHNKSRGTINDFSFQKTMGITEFAAGKVFDHLASRGMIVTS